jgi:hypothetical protein
VRQRSKAARLLVPILLLAIAAGCGGAKAETPGSVAVRLQKRLEARDLPPRWVVCVASRMRLSGRTVFRCNVNFGDPHIEIYCAVAAGRGVRAAEWRGAVRGREDRLASQRECARRLSRGLG